MARTVNRTFKQFLPGAGSDVSGSPKQGKTRVVGRVNVTSYARGGEALSPNDIGLSTIDHIDLKVVGQVSNADGIATREAKYSNSTSQFYLIDVAVAGDKTQMAAAATEAVTYDAFGDSANDVELL
jgi:hypothetical protein